MAGPRTRSRHRARTAAGRSGPQRTHSVGIGWAQAGWPDSTIVTTTLRRSAPSARPEGSSRSRRAAVAALLGATAVLYLWGLSASGWANAFYAAAAQAGGEDWTAWFFGSSDAANSITVDKTPAALWVMGLSVRMFGLSSWSILVPQALMGVATVGLLYATVRRTAGDVAGLLAGAALALTPVAVLMYRFDTPTPC